MAYIDDLGLKSSRFFFECKCLHKNFFVSFNAIPLVSIFYPILGFLACTEKLHLRMYHNKSCSLNYIFSFFLVIFDLNLEYIKSLASQSI